MRLIGRSRALLATVAAALLLTACGSGPSQVGSAAIIGDRAVPLGDIQQQIQWLLDNVPEAKQAQDQRKLDNTARDIVSRRVLHELVTVAAQREGLRPDPTQVQQLIDSTGGLDAAARQVQVTPDQVRQVAADQVLVQELGRRYVDRVSASLVGTVITSERPGATAEQQARELGRQLVDNPGAAEQAVRANAAQSGAEVTKGRYTPAQIIEQARQGRRTGTGSTIVAFLQAFGTRPGTVVVANLGDQRQAGWLVALVEDRTIGPATGQPAEGSVPSQALYEVGLRMLQPIAEELGVRINPRYGVWDPLAMSVAPGEEQRIGQLLRPRTVRP